MKKPQVDALAQRAPRDSEPPAPQLPAWKAFVVQFTRDASVTSGIFNGRVEHLSSGQRARFDSSDELVQLLRQLLDDLGKARS